MKISYSWLQTYFNKKLPKPEKLAELLTLHSFETSVAKIKSDWIFDIDVTPNRASDCLNHRGVAREIAAIINSKIKSQKSKLQFKSQNLNKNLEVKVEEPGLCPRYIARVITGVTVQESPKWLKEKLESIGQRSINNIVDVINYTMFDLGQPMHAFDLDKLSGQKIIVRKAKNGEKITTLDGEKYDLDESVLVIADSKEPIALAGIKGGKKAEIDKNTKNIVLESANFDSINIRRTSKKLNLKTESSLRFEAGMDANLAEEAIDAISSGNKINIYPRPLMPRKISFHPFDVKNLLGVEISEKEILKILINLNFKIEKINLRKKIVDLAKKMIGRPYAYGARTTDAPEKFDCSSLTKYIYWQAGLEIPRISVEQFLTGLPIEKKDLKPGDLVFSKGRQPYYYKETPQGVGHVGIYIGKNQVIHASSKAGKVVQQNIKVFSKEWRGARRFLDEQNDLFLVAVPSWRLDVKLKEDLIEEIARIYGYQKISFLLPKVLLLPLKRNNEIYWENVIKDILIGAGWTEVYNYSFSTFGKIEISNPISQAKRYLRSSLVPGLLENVGNNLRFFDEVKIFEIGKVFSSEKKMFAGVLSYKNPRVHGAAFYEIKGVLEAIFNKMGLRNKAMEFIKEVNKNTAVWELDLEKLIVSANEEIIFQPLAKYPAITRDLAILVQRGVPAENVLDIIKNSGGSLLIDIDLFDVYENEKNLGEKKSLAFHLIFQSLKKTLTDGEVNNLMNKIMKVIKEKDFEVR